jgi:hypothetical protein
MEQVEVPFERVLDHGGRRSGPSTRAGDGSRHADPVGAGARARFHPAGRRAVAAVRRARGPHGRRPRDTRARRSTSPATCSRCGAVSPTCARARPSGSRRRPGLGDRRGDGIGVALNLGDEPAAAPLAARRCWHRPARLRARAIDGGPSLPGAASCSRSMADAPRVPREPLRGALAVVRPATVDDATLLVEWHADPGGGAVLGRRDPGSGGGAADLARPEVDAYVVEADGRAGGLPAGVVRRPAGRRGDRPGHVPDPHRRAAGASAPRRRACSPGTCSTTSAASA